MSNVALKELEVRDRWSGELLKKVPLPSREEVKEALQKTREAAKSWGKLTPEERAKQMTPLREVLLRKKHVLADLISKEVGKPILEAISMEILPAFEALEYVLTEGPALLAPQKLPHRRMKIYRSEVWREPHGVVGLITPWNFPFFLSFTPLLSALIAGNGVVLKPSEYTPLSVLEIASLVEDAGLPQHLVTILPGDGQVGQWILEEGVDKVCFTGSVATGRKVAALCGERLIPVSLELGGKDPMIVLDDADIERAVRGAVWAGFANTGQICASVERVFVARPVYERFLHLLKDEVAKIRQGKNRYESDLGPMNNECQYKIVEEQVQEALDKGATLVAGGKGDGTFFAPTVLTEVGENMKIWQEETFGPVLWVQPFDKDEEACELANATPFGLSASVWSQNSERAWALAKKLHFGFVYINDHLGGAGAGEVAWGGVKASGHGRTRGAEGILAMTRTKYVSEDTAQAARPPHWFPYSQEKYEHFLELCEDLYGKSRMRKFIGMLKFLWLLFRD